MLTLETELSPRMPTEANSSQAQARGDDVNDDVRSFPGVWTDHTAEWIGSGVRGQGEVLIPGWQGVPVWLQVTTCVGCSVLGS